jgi:hypothetical protein
MVCCPTDDELYDLAEKLEPRGAKVFPLVPLAASSFNGHEDESRLVPSLVD